MSTISSLYTRFVDLSWWQMGLWIIYVVYFGVKAKWFWEATSNNGIVKGYREVIFDSGRTFRVYHIILIIFDIPPALIGLTFPFLRRVLRFKIYEFAPEKPEEYKYLVSIKENDTEIIIDRNIYAISRIAAKEKVANESTLEYKNLYAYRMQAGE